MAASRSFNQRTFEEYDPNVEWSRDAEAETVRISLPEFKREEIRVLVDNHGHLRTRGERPVAGTRWGRFQKDFQLPDNCNVDGIRAKFENETLTITLPKKTPSPPSGPVTPQTPVLAEPPTRPSAAVPSQRLPSALPEPAARPAAPPTVPAATLAPAASQKPPAAERRPSMTRKPAPAPKEEQPKSYNGGGGASAATKPQSSPAAAVTRQDQEEEEREAAGKMTEDTKAKKQQGDEAVAAEMALASQPRPVSAARGLLMNAAVAAVLLLGITVYVWHTLRNATGGAGGHGHGHLGAGSYGDEM